MKRLVWLLWLACVLSAFAACSKCGSAQTPDDAAVLAEPAVPAPEKLIADVAFASPTTTWTRLQRGIGGAVGLLPSNAGGILCTALELDPALGQEIDGMSPAFAAIAGDPVDPSWAIAMKLVDLRRARTTLVEAETARFLSREANGYTEVLPKTESQKAGVAMALTRGGYLVFARRASDLALLGPYVSRTLPTREVPRSGAVAIVSRTAMETVVVPRLESGWAEVKAFLSAEDQKARRAHRGRAPDYGDPQAVVDALDSAATKRIAIARDLETLRMAFDTDENGASLSLSMTPRAGEGPASKWIGSMRGGGPEPVLAMSATSAVALVVRDSGGDGDAVAADFEKTVKGMLGARVTDADAKKLHELALDVAKARGDSFGAALAWDEPRGLLLRGSVKDTEAATRAIRGGVDVLRLLPIREALHLEGVKVAPAEAPPLEKVELATFEMAKGDAGAKHAKDAQALGMAWSLGASAVEVGAGPEPLVTLRTQARPDRALTSEPSVVRALAALGQDASVIVVAQPLRFDPKRASLPTAPVVFGVGKREKDAFVRLDVSTGVLREMTRWVMGM